MERTLDDREDYSGRFRVRSERRRRRAVKDEYDKLLIRLGREWQASSRKLYNLGWEDLHPPVQRGYVRFFVLRDDVKRTKQAGFFEKLLEKINVRQWSHRKDFLVKRRRHGKKAYVPRLHTLHALESWELRKVKLTVEEWKYFHIDTVYDAKHRHSRIVHRFTEPWRFVLRIQPNMITKKRKTDVDLERHHAALDRYFSRDDHWEHWVKLSHGSVHRSHSWLPKRPTPEKYKSPFLNRSFSDILSEYYPGPTLRITHKDPQAPGDLYFDHFKAVIASLRLAAVSVTRDALPANACANCCCANTNVNTNVNVSARRLLAQV